MKRLLAACLLACACAAPPPKTPQPEPTGQGQREMEVLLALMMGTWDARPGTLPIRLRIVEFWKGKPNEHWVYLEWVKPDDEKQPVRQRIYRFSEGGGTILAQVFLPPGRDPAVHVGEWRNAAPFARYSPRDLRPLAGCDLLFEYRHGAIFAGGTLAKSCRGDRPDPLAERSEFLVTSSESRNLEQAYDASGKPIGVDTPLYDLVKSSREAM
jgi:hypothetical protein